MPMRNGRWVKILLWTGLDRGGNRLWIQLELPSANIGRQNRKLTMAQQFLKRNADDANSPEYVDGRFQCQPFDLERQLCCFSAAQRYDCDQENEFCYKTLNSIKILIYNKKRKFSLFTSFWFDPSIGWCVGHFCQWDESEMGNSPPSSKSLANSTHNDFKQKLFLELRENVKMMYT